MKKIAYNWTQPRLWEYTCSVCTLVHLANCFHCYVTIKIL